MSESTTESTTAAGAAPTQPVASAQGPAILLLIAAFQSEQAADDAKDMLEQARKQQNVPIRDIAVIRCDANKKIHIKETKDMSGGQGALRGGIVGGLLGLAAGPVGWAIVGGAVVGGVAAKLRDGGFRDENLQKLGAGLQPNTSAVVCLIGDASAKDVRKMLEQSGAKVDAAPLGADVAKALGEGKDIAYAMGATQDGAMAARVASSADELEYNSMVATDQGVYVEGVKANKDGVVAGAAVITEEGASGVIVEAKPVKTAETPAIEGEKPAAEGETK